MLFRCVLWCYLFYLSLYIVFFFWKQTIVFQLNVTTTKCINRAFALNVSKTVIWWDATRVNIWHHKLNVYLGIIVPTIILPGVKKPRYPPSAEIRSWSSNTNPALIIVSDWQYRLVRVSSLPNRDIAPGHFQYCKKQVHKRLWFPKCSRDGQYSLQMLSSPNIHMKSF